MLRTGSIDVYELLNSIVNYKKEQDLSPNMGLLVPFLKRILTLLGHKLMDCLDKALRIFQHAKMTSSRNGFI